jgi:hypothetical protein
MSLEDESKQPLNYLPLQGIVLSAVLPFVYSLPTSHRRCFAGNNTAQTPLLGLRVTRGLTAGASIFRVIGMRSYSGVMVTFIQI